MAKSAARIQFLSDILCTIIEGAVDYWAIPINSTRVDDPNNCLGWRYDTFTFKADDEPQVYTVNINDIARGVNRLCESKINNDWVNAMREANKTNGDEGDIDAMNCDMVLQYAVFGETVYG